MMRIWYDSRPVARLTRAGQFIALRYEESWLDTPEAFALSASLPLGVAPIENVKVERWLESLLPENRGYLEHLAHAHGVRDASNTLELLGAIGMDVPGALAILPDSERPDTRIQLEEVSEEDIAADLSVLRESASPQGVRLSLAGAQPKTALYRGRDGRWYRPSYAAASTHILKPPMPRNDGVDWVEFAMQEVASRLGIDAARSQVRTFAGVDAFVSTRFDRRVRSDGTVERLHTEDLLQVLGFPRYRKYQKGDGGPGVRELIGAIRRLDPDAEQEAWARLAFNARCRKGA